MDSRGAWQETRKKAMKFIGKVNSKKVLAHTLMASIVLTLGLILAPPPLNIWAGAGLAFAVLLGATALVERFVHDRD